MTSTSVAAASKSTRGGGLQNNVITKDPTINSNATSVANNVTTKEISNTITSKTKINNATTIATKLQNQDTSRPRLVSNSIPPPAPTASMLSSPGFPTPTGSISSSASMSRTNSLVSSSSTINNHPTPRPSFHSPSPSPFRPIQSPGPQTYQNISSPVKPSPTISIANQQQQQQASQLRKKLEHSNSTGEFYYTLLFFYYCKMVGRKILFVFFLLEKRSCFNIFVIFFRCVEHRAPIRTT